MKAKKFTNLLLILALLFSMFGSGFDSVSREEFNKEIFKDKYEPKVFSKADIDQDFSDDTVLIVMDKSVGAINKVHDKKFFGDIEIEEIIDLSVVVNEALLSNDDLRHAPKKDTWEAEFIAEQKQFNAKNQTKQNKEFQEIVQNLDEDWQIDREEFRQILKLKLPIKNKQNVLDVIAKLEKIEGIRSAGPDYVAQIASVAPNDPYFTNEEQWALKKISVPAAWKFTTGSRNVRVGVIDSGVSEHIDFGSGSSKNLVGGWNFFQANNNTEDIYPHGTQVAGIIGAVGNNGIGITGICQEISIVPLMVYKRVYYPGVPTSELQIYVEGIIEAIIYAQNYNIPILNISLGVPPGLTADAQYQAIKNYSGLVVASAGNDGYNLELNPTYPASHKLPNVITVGASDSNDQRSIWSYVQSSNHGANSVHLFAPGGQGMDNNSALKVITTGLDNTYITFGGTSSAAPHVAGVAALIKSKYPGLNTLQIKQAILDGVDTVANGGLPADTNLTNICITGGRLNAYKALVVAGSVKLKGDQGIYNVRNASTGYYLNSTPTGYSLVQNKNLDSDSQKWIIQRMGLSGYTDIRNFSITNSYTGGGPFVSTYGTGGEDIISMSSGPTNNFLTAVGNNVQYILNNGALTSAQKWYIEPHPNVYTQGDVNRDGVIDFQDVELVKSFVRSNNPVIPTSLQLYLADVNHDGQITQADVDILTNLGQQPFQDGWYNIQGYYGRNLQVENNSPNNGSRLYLWDNSTANDSAKFYFEYQGDGYYRIKTALSNRYVEVSNSSLDNYANVAIYDWANGYDCKLWKLQKHGNYYIFINKNSGKVIDVANGWNFNGAYTWQHTLNYSEAQQFKLLPIARAKNLLTPTMTSNISPVPYVITAKNDGDSSETYKGWRAFDGNWKTDLLTDSNYWWSGYGLFNNTTGIGEAWVQIDFGENEQRSANEVQFQNGFRSGIARDIQLEGSNDGTYFTTLLSLNDIPEDTDIYNPKKYVYSFNNTVSYRYYRFKILRVYYRPGTNAGQQYASIGELELWRNIF
ncbi:MAG: S8 family serine peptidase [Oscillospiraceae bacterium]|nr:S8 family serine peptidase [Oscillospiraceae bacterium]